MRQCANKVACAPLHCCNYLPPATIGGAYYISRLSVRAPNAKYAVIAHICVACLTGGGSHGADQKQSPSGWTFDWTTTVNLPREGYYTIDARSVTWSGWFAG